MRTSRLIAPLFVLAGLAGSVAAQEWYIPKRTRILNKGYLELGTRLQMSTNNDGLLDTTRGDNVWSLRYSPISRLEVYVDAPLVYVMRERIDGVNIEREEMTGVGDAFSQVTFELASGADWKVLWNVDTVWPSGKNPYRHQTPTGTGHFSVGWGQTAMKVIDPVVLFVYGGVQRTLSRRFVADRIDPGWSYRLRLGNAIALNPRVQTALHMTTEFLTRTTVNRVPVQGTAETLVRLGWGLDWTLSRRVKLSTDAAFGMTKSTPDATLVAGVTVGFGGE